MKFEKIEDFEASVDRYASAVGGCTTESRRIVTDDGAVLLLQLVSLGLDTKADELVDDVMAKLERAAAPTAIYEIAPLKFKKQKSVGRDKRYEATTPFGQFDISYDAVFSLWRWSYCFDEYHDEDSFICENLKDGKEQANAFWRERLRPALTLSEPSEKGPGND